MDIKAVIYARVSTKEQADPESKFSIPDQIENCERAIKEHGWKLIGEPFIDAGLSGHLLEERLGLQAMLKDAREHKFDLIVVKDFDRFARNRAAATVVREELKQLFIQTYAVNTPVEPKEPNIYDPDEDDMGVIVEGVSDIRSDLERKAIIRRMKMGKKQKALDGKIPNKVPYGYKIVRTLDVKGKVLREVVVDEEEAKWVRYIYRRYIEGAGARKIALELTEKNVKPPSGSQWSITTLKYLLKNPTYTGKVWWGWRHAEYKKTKERQRRGQEGIIVDGNHLPIIDEPTFKLAQEIHEQRGAKSRGNAALSRGLLTGIAKCIRCGKGVSYSKRVHKHSKENPKWKDSVTFEYLCGGYKYTNICSPRVMSAIKLESAVLDQIRNIFYNPKVQEKIIYESNGEDKKELEVDLARSERELAKIPEKRKLHQEAYEKRLETAEEFGIAMERLRQDEKRYHGDIISTKSDLLKQGQTSLSLKKFVATLKDFDKMWKELELDEKRQILRATVREIRAGNGKVQVDFIL